MEAIYEKPTKNPQKTHKKPTKNPQKTHKKPTKNRLAVDDGSLSTSGYILWKLNIILLYHKKHEKHEKQYTKKRRGEALFYKVVLITILE